MEARLKSLAGEEIAATAEVAHLDESIAQLREQLGSSRAIHEGLRLIKLQNVSEIARMRNEVDESAKIVLSCHHTAAALKSRIADATAAMIQAQKDLEDAKVVVASDPPFWGVEQAGVREVAVLTGAEGSIFAIAFSPNNKWMIVDAHDANLRIYSVEELYAVTSTPLASLPNRTMQPVALRHKKGRLGNYRSVRFNADGSRMVIADANQLVEVWDTSDAHPSAWTSIRTLRGHTSSIQGVDIAPDASIVVSSAGDGTTRVWDVESSTCRHTLNCGGGLIYSVSLSPDAGRVASACADGAVRVFDTTTGATIHTLTGLPGEARTVTWSPDGTTIVGGSRDRAMIGWTADTGVKSHTALPNRSDRVNVVTFSPRGRYFAATSGDGTVAVYELETQRVGYTTRIGGSQIGVAFSRDCLLLAVGASGDNTVRVFAQTSGT